jgi:hypothetical protein
VTDADGHICASVQAAWRTPGRDGQTGTMRTNGGNYAGSGQKIVVPPFIGVSADVTLNLGVLWDNMNIYMTCDCIGINFYVEMFGVKTFV